MRSSNGVGILILNLSLFFFNCCNFGNIPIRSCLWKAFDVENSPKISFSVDQANLNAIFELQRGLL